MLQIIGGIRLEEVHQSLWQIEWKAMSRTECDVVNRHALRKSQRYVREATQRCSGRVSAQLEDGVGTGKAGEEGCEAFGVPQVSVLSPSKQSAPLGSLCRSFRSTQTTLLPFASPRMVTIRFTNRKWSSG